MRRIGIVVSWLLLTACAAPPAIPPAAPTTVAASPTTPASPTVALTPTTAASPTVGSSALIEPASVWAGAITAGDGTATSIVVALDGSSGTLTTQPRSATQPLRDLQRTATTLAFSVTGNPELRFSGTWAAGQITGVVEGAGQTSPLVLTPLLADTAAPEAYAGTYRFASGAALTVHLAPRFASDGLDFFWSPLMLTHFGTGAVRGLYPLAPDTFAVGRARVLGYPFAAQVRFTRDAAGGVVGLRWQTRDPTTGTLGAEQPAARLALETETVAFTSADGVTLAGLVTAPATPGPHPGMVVLHGSERGTRDDFLRQQLRTFLASQGFVVLTYDKRGVGESGGTYQEAASDANLTRLAHDAVAGVRLLRRRTDVDAAHIGLIGSSQAGWTIPLAAAETPDVARFVILSGPAVSVGTEAAYSSYTADGAAVERFTAQEIAAKLAQLAPSGFDPAPVIAGLAQPGLWLWGSQDKSVPVPESAAVLDARIAQGQSNLSYHIFADADHNLQATQQGRFAELPVSAGYPEDFFTTLAAWLSAR